MFGIVRYSTNFAWLEVEKEFGQLYRRLFIYDYGIKLQAPSNGEHITIIGDRERDKIGSMWTYMSGKPMQFSVSSIPWSNGNAIWLDVCSCDIEDFRRTLGLDNPMEPPLHFCIGYLGANDG